MQTFPILLGILCIFFLAIIHDNDTDDPKGLSSCGGSSTGETYPGEIYTGYDYDRENPNALMSGREVAGTVYADNEESPGLGWVL